MGRLGPVDESTDRSGDLDSVGRYRGTVEKKVMDVTFGNEGTYGTFNVIKGLP